MKIKIDHDKIFVPEGKKPTVIVKFYGTRAYSSNHATTAVILQKKLGLLSTEMERIYRFETPGIFFVKLTEEGINKTKETFVEHDGFQASVSMLARNQRATLHWARSGMTATTINEIPIRVISLV